ncbi:MAG TPA: GNAT family N-acetyltransferase [Candidatus Gracilibacteria bacterium]
MRLTTLDQVHPFYQTPQERLEDDDPTAFIVFFVQGTVLGILNIHVPKDQRRQRVGQRLIESLIALALQRNISVISGKIGPTDSTPQQALITFYERMGFEIYPMEMYHDAPLVLKQLKPEALTDPAQNPD